jgi:hypothetical protein
MDAKSGSLNQDIVSKRFDGTTEEYRLAWIQSSDRFQFITYDSAGTIVGNVAANNLGSPSVDTWYHIVAYSDAENDEVGIIVDDGTADIDTSMGGLGVVSDTTSDFVIGAVDDTGGDYWDGRIDEVGFWKKVLSGQEIEDLYNSGSSMTYYESTSGYAENRIESKDLSDYDFLTFWAKSSNAGDTLKLSFGETDSDEHEGLFKIDNIDQWQKIYWDISHIPDHERDGVRNLRIDTYSSQNTLFIDNIRAERLMTNPNGSIIKSTPNEYLQYRVILASSEPGSFPILHNVEAEWGNGFKIEQTDSNTVRLYNMTGEDQQLRLDAIVFGADLAEWYTVDDLSIEPGDLVALTGEMDEFGVPILTKAAGSDKNLLGGISTKAGQALGLEAPNRRLLGLAGRIPVKIDPESPSIKAGDFITASPNEPGLGYKAGATDIAIGKALSDWDEPQENEISEISTVLIYIVDPTNRLVLNVEDVGNYVIQKSEDGMYRVANIYTDEVIEPGIVLAEAVIANIKAGSIETQELLVEGTATITDTLIAGAIESQEIATDSFLAFQGTIDDLLITNGLVSPVIKTEMISPIVDSDLVIDLDNSAPEATESAYGKLIVKGKDGEEVVSIDAEGNATFSGTLESEEVVTKELIADRIYVDEIISKSSPSDESPITIEQIEELLKQSQEDQQTLTNVTDSNIFTATESARLEELALGQLYVTGQTAINALSVSSSLTIGSDFVVQSFTDENGIIINSLDTLTAPLKLQSLAMAPLEIMAGKVRIDTNGNMEISGNLYVAGQIEASGLTLKSNDLENNSDFGDLLSLIDSEGIQVANIDASGAAQFSSVSIDKLIIASSDLSLVEPNIDGEIETNATAGKAVIPAGTTEITINNPNVGDYTLVYVTPTSPTLNNVLYVKNKQEGSFAVGFSNPLSTDVNFNWWVIDIAE